MNLESGSNMIEFIKKFLASMSDSELDYVQRAVWKEMNHRLENKRAINKANGIITPDLNDDEKTSLLKGEYIEVIKAYRLRTGTTLKESRNIVDDWKNSRPRG